MTGTNEEIIAKLRADIQAMKQKTEKVIVLWTANTEMYFKPEIQTAEELMAKVKNNETLPASVLYCIATMDENSVYLNGSP